ncbi:MAG: NAD-dependent 4,6-dehydratase LegB [Candidatus Omnitrophota bacterium]
MELKHKKVLVTGACGFIGSHLVERLLGEGCEVKAFVFYNSFNSWGWLEAFPKKKLKDVEIFCGDIRDSNGVKTAVKGAEAVFHLAALIGIPYSYHSPDSYVDTNIKGTLNVLQACRDFSVRKIIVTSTSEVYGTARRVPIDESHPLQGQSPYSASKIGADKIAESFHLSFNLPVAVARPFNTYGPRQSARAVIPTIISQALSAEKKIKLGNLSPRRDLNYVEDICEGFLEIAKSEKTVGKVMNICSGSEVSIGELAGLILDMTGKNKKIITDSGRIRPENSEVERLLGDNSLIRSLTNWRPAHSLRDGISRTIDWFSDKKNLALYKTGIYNI